MYKDILVAIIEDDLFSLNWMSLLLVRDWRTRVVSGIQNVEQLNRTLNEFQNRIDFFLVDIDAINSDCELTDICKLIYQKNEKAKIIFIGVGPSKSVFKYMQNLNCFGYINKNEIRFSLSWAISLAAEGNFVLTRSTFDLFNQANYILPQNKLILKGRDFFLGLTDRENEVAKLAIIFSLGRRDLADELKISDQWCYGLVSELYTKLGIGDILSGDVDPSIFFGESKVINDHYKEIITQLKTSTKARDLETLAFHLLTMPIIED